MLQTLKIENVALIDKVELDFDEKLNVISGETGAGKSIMLDALSFVFGGRADRSLIRTGRLPIFWQASSVSTQNATLSTITSAARQPNGTLSQDDGAPRRQAGRNLSPH